MGHNTEEIDFDSPVLFYLFCLLAYSSFFMERVLKCTDCCIVLTLVSSCSSFLDQLEVETACYLLSVGDCVAYIHINS